MKTNGKLEKSTKVSPHIYEIIQLLCKVIKERRLLNFPYESKRRNELREIRPYMIIPREKKGSLRFEEILELVGLPTEQLKTTERQPGHYFLHKLNMKHIKILDEPFDDPGVSRAIVIHTKNPVVCRFIYDDEDPKEVMKSWIKILKK